MIDMYRYLDQSSKTTQDLVQYLVVEGQDELLSVVMDMLKCMAEQSGELTALRRRVEVAENETK